MNFVIDLTESNNKVVDFMGAVSRRANRIRKAYETEAVEIEIKPKYCWKPDTIYHYHTYVVCFSNHFIVKTVCKHRYMSDTLFNYKEKMIEGDVVDYIRENAKEIISSIWD